MAPIKKLKSGSTSTFIPGGTGSSGTRAGVTFYGSKSKYAQTSNTITFRLNNENVTIDNQYGNILNPAINDFIVYADSNITYLLSIVDILESICYTEVIDSWNTQSQSSDDQKTDISTISLDIECNASDSQDYIGYKKFISTSVISDGTQSRILTLVKRDLPGISSIHFFKSFSAALKFDTTPDFIGLIADIFSGVLPNSSLALSPTAKISPVKSFIATTVGPENITPLSLR